MLIREKYSCEREITSKCVRLTLNARDLRALGGGGGEGVPFLVQGYWGRADGWVRIFTELD